MTQVEHAAPGAAPPAGLVESGGKPLRPPVRIFFGRQLVDHTIDWIGSPIAKVSPFFGNAYDDGTTARTLLGNLYFILPIAGVVLGIMAVHNTHGFAVPPVLWLMLTITALGIMDAFSGLTATVAFTVGVVGSGHLFSSHWLYAPPGHQSVLFAFTGILTMFFAWAIAPTLPRRIRTLGFRAIKNTTQRRYVMAGDFFVVTLLMILILGALPVFVPIFTGANREALTQVVIQNHLVVVKIVVGIAAFVRVFFDEIVHARFEPLPKSAGHSRAAVTRNVLRLVAAAIVLALVWELLGKIWQWPVVWALLMSSEWLTAAGERFLKPSALYRYVPRYLFRIVTLLLFDEYAARELAGRLVTGVELLGWLVFLLVVVISIYAILDGPDVSEEEKRPNWLTRIIGIIVVAALFVLSQNIWAISATPYSRPAAVAVSPTGTLFIADSGNNRVIEVTSTGARGTVGSNLNDPRGVAYDTTPGSPASLYIANTGDNDVVRAELHPVYALAPPGQFGHVASAEAPTPQVVVGHGLLDPTGLATNAEGALYICDTGHDRIVEILPNGTQITVATKVPDPTAVSADPFGNIYVTLGSMGEVVRYTIGSNGSAGQGNKPVVGKVVVRGLDDPSGVAADAGYDLYVSDTGQNRVYEYLHDGQRRTVPGHYLDPRGLAVDGAGHLYIADAGHGAVTLVSPVFIPTTLSYGPTNVATAVAVGKGESFYTINSADGTLEEVSSIGPTVLMTGLDDPTGVVDANNGHLYLAFARTGTIDEVVRASATGYRLVPFAHGLPGVTALARDGGRGLLALLPGRGTVASVSFKGAVAGLYRGLDDPTSLVLDGYGNVDVTELYKHLGRVVLAIAPDGKGTVVADHLNEAGSLATDANANLYYIDYTHHQVWEILGLLGNQLVYQGTGFSTDPVAIAVTPNGDVTIFPEVPNTLIHLHGTLTTFSI